MSARPTNAAPPASSGLKASGPGAFDRALDEDIILLLGPTEDVDVVETRDLFAVRSGACIFVSTSDGGGRRVASR